MVELTPEFKKVLPLDVVGAALMVAAFLGWLPDVFLWIGALVVFGAGWWMVRLAEQAGREEAAEGASAEGDGTGAGNGEP